MQKNLDSEDEAEACLSPAECDCTNCQNKQAEDSDNQSDEHMGSIMMMKRSEDDKLQASSFQMSKRRGTSKTSKVFPEHIVTIKGVEDLIQSKEHQQSGSSVEDLQSEIKYLKRKAEEHTSEISKLWKILKRKGILS